MRAANPAARTRGGRDMATEMKLPDLRAALTDLPPEGRLGMPADEYRKLFQSDDEARQMARSEHCVLESDELSFWFVKSNQPGGESLGFLPN
jgi:hypothetical protein